MNVRDPFNLRRSNNFTSLDVLRATATRAAGNIGQKALEAGANVLEKGKQAVEDMSFSVPKNVPSFGNPQRIAEDHLWAARGSASARPGGLLDDVQNRVGGILHPNRASLPMYKDKPFAYAPSYRARPLYRKKRVLGLFTLIVLIFLWYRGYFAEHHEKAVAKLNEWNWIKNEGGKAKSKADWLKRRERVVEAFELSWDAYERHAWGEPYALPPL
jgi:mannosyl-oligosaccharide alpha-1,2-mannosidase